MPLPVLNVHLDSPIGNSAVVQLDGHDISAGLQELSISFGIGEVTRAELVISVGALEIDAPTLAILQANVKACEPPDPDPFPTFGTKE